MIEAADFGRFAFQDSPNKKTFDVDYDWAVEKKGKWKIVPGSVVISKTMDVLTRLGYVRKKWTLYFCMVDIVGHILTRTSLVPGEAMATCLFQLGSL